MHAYVITICSIYLIYYFILELSSIKYKVFSLVSIYNNMVINDLNDEIRSLKEICAENNVSLTGFINERLKAMNEIRKVDFIIFYF